MNLTVEYLNNATFQKIIARFIAAKENKENDKQEFIEAQMEIYKAFNTLSQNIIRAFKFNLVDSDDALQEGVLICFEKIHRFDPKRGSSAFSFCTTVILNHYRHLYRLAKNYNEFKIKYHNVLTDQLDEVHISNYKSRKGSFCRFGENNKYFIERDDY